MGIILLVSSSLCNIRGFVNFLFKSASFINLK